jgi:hypothetical protein
LNGTISGEPARLQFLSDWRIVKHGDIRPNGKLVIVYDTRRLPNYRHEFRGSVYWNIEIYIRFHPRCELQKGSLLEPARYEGESWNPAYGPGPVIDYVVKPFEIVVPAGATQVELWFRTYNDFRWFSEAWDSRFGQNYWFDVADESATHSVSNEMRQSFNS